MIQRRRAALFTASLVAIVVIGGLLPVGLMYARLHPARTRLTDDPGRHGLAYQDVAFASLFDGVTLRGWYMPTSGSGGRTVVVVPGIDDDREVSGITLALAPQLVARGMSVLAFDLRAEGESGGDLQTFGARESWDVLAAVAEARARGARSVGVLGFSLGAVAAILAAARSTGIDALVADSAFAELSATLRHELGVNDHLPGPFVEAGIALFQVMSGVDPATVAPVRAIGSLGARPVLLIHGSEDATVPPSDLDRLARAAGTSADAWLVPGGRHAKSYEADPAGYAARVCGFLDEALR